MRKFLFAVTVAICLMAGSLIAKAQDNGVSGKWHFVLDTPGGDREVDAEFVVAADGKVTGNFGKTSAVGTYSDGSLKLDFEMTSEESGDTGPMKIVGKLDDPATLTGTWQFTSYDGTFKAMRPKK
jgi:hypothetical protein